MITIISGTHRTDSNTLKISEIYKSAIGEAIKEEEVKIFSMTQFATELSMNDLYQYHHPTLQKMLDEYFIPAQKIIIVVPEYNGSFPGILKLFIDSVKPELYKNKTFALVGLGTGRGGNLRGIDQLTNILHYLGADVVALKLPLSRINETIFPKNQDNEELILALKEQFKIQLAKLLSA
jgi:chromate reductase, NAD(P)H dehydrogenase (quinone)